MELKRLESGLMIGFAKSTSVFSCICANLDSRSFYLHDCLARNEKDREKSTVFFHLLKEKLLESIALQISEGPSDHHGFSLSSARVRPLSSQAM